jgi:hypothetical protein
MENEVIGPFFFEEPTMSSDTFLAMMENTGLHHAPMGTVFQSDGAPPHFSHHVHSFLDREFPDCWMGRDGPIPWPPHSRD